MQKESGDIKAGTVINITNGCYSDYSLMGSFVACKNFNYIEEANAFYLTLTKDEIEDYDVSNLYIIYLIKNELIVECNHTQLHCGNYGFDIVERNSQDNKTEAIKRLEKFTAPIED